VNRQPLPVDEICRVLEIPRETVTDLASLKTLAGRARRRLAARHHPDRGGDPAQMAAINRVADHVEHSDVLWTPALPPTGQLLHDTMARWCAAHGVRFQPFARPADQRSFVEAFASAQAQRGLGD
jgi:hypothetical protein